MMTACGGGLAIGIAGEKLLGDVKHTSVAAFERVVAGNTAWAR